MGLMGAGGGCGQSTGFTVWAPPGHPQMKVRQACPPPASWLREDGWALGRGSHQTHPILWLQEASGHVWLICSSQAPSLWEGGKHQGPAARPKVKEHPERNPLGVTCSWNGQPAPAAFPEMVVGSRGRRLSPHPLGHCCLQTLSPRLSVSPLFPGFSARDPRVHISVRVPRLDQGWVWSGCTGLPLGGAGLVIQYATWCRKRPPRADQGVRRWEGPAPQVPNVHWAGAGT